MIRPLASVLAGIEFESRGLLPNEIVSLVFDSRSCESGTLFFAIRGERQDGHQYVAEAFRRGAIGAVVEDWLTESPLPQIRVADTKAALSRAAANYYGDPSVGMKVVGVTGTNGKTTTVFLIHQICQAAGLSSGTIGTLGYTINREHHPLNLTTPDSLTLHSILHRMAEASVTICAMEVSSHSLALKRAQDIHFGAAIFTNLTQDHLDYHLTMENYADAKIRLFQQVSPFGVALCNHDDPVTPRFIDSSNAPVMTYGLQSAADYRWSQDTTSQTGIQGTIIAPQTTLDISCPLSGRFNLYNILAAVALADQLGLPHTAIRSALKMIQGVPGRLQEIRYPGKPRIFIDYAHTPDAIINTLAALREMVSGGALVALFGCGGNRDKTKRPRMAAAVESLADFAILTTDNPRDEAPQAIINDAVCGFTGRIPYITIVDRTEAIHYALDHFNSHDIVALLGKGHETYQEIRGQRIPYNEFQIIKDYLES